MPINVVLEDNLYCPQVFCDHCGQRIGGASAGNYEWEVDEQWQLVSGQLCFTHKQCCRDFENAHGGRSRWMCFELAELPKYLARNIELEGKR